MAEEDVELTAMQQVVAALQGLDDETKARVLEWTARRFHVSLGSGIRRPARGGRLGTNDGAGADEPETEFEHFADLLDAANPTDEDDRALVGGYWFQVVRGTPSFAGQQVNDSLKDTGHGIDNITRSFDRLQARKPAEVRQLSKSGRARQARKKYKLTNAGVNHVQRMMGGEDAAEGDEE
jgi:hypothetical protein